MLFKVGYIRNQFTVHKVLKILTLPVSYLLEFNKLILLFKQVFPMRYSFQIFNSLSANHST